MHAARRQPALRTPAATAASTRRSRRRVSRGMPRPGFSMAELMIAVVILGIGLLITSSMFPIAWYKAREVAEATSMPAMADHAEAAVRFLAQRVNGPYDTTSMRDTHSAFFPGDFFVDEVQGNANLAGVVAAGYPDTRVHVLNLGNFGVGFPGDEPNPLDPSNTADYRPVADHAWTLDDNMNPWFTNSLYTAQFNAYNVQHSYGAAHARVFPPMTEPRPDPADPAVDPLQVSHWDEQFELRRYCWAVLYRFGNLAGPNGDSVSSAVGGCRSTQNSATCDDARFETSRSMRRPRHLTFYYVTLKRPAGARYARQEGYVFNSGGGVWNAAKQPATPRAQIASGNKVTELLLPTPWRIEAALVTVPPFPQATYPASPTGIPSEIRVSDAVAASILQEGTHLIDDRTGKVVRVTQIRDASGGGVVAVLDQEYTQRDVHVADYVPFPADTGNPATLGGNWVNRWDWLAQGCDADPSQNACRPVPSGIGEDQPEQRFYWVFPPPVEAVESGGIPVFDGSTPVVSIETRHMVIAP